MSEERASYQVALISPVECKHRRTSSLQSGSAISTSEHSRYNIFLCCDCGQFMIRGMMNGEYYSIDFTLIRREDLEAAGKAVEYYNQDSQKDCMECGEKATFLKKVCERWLCEVCWSEQ